LFKTGEKIMKYNKIIEYFESGESGITQLLKDCDTVFDQLEQYKQDFMANMITTVEEYKEKLNVLTGIYGFLEPIFNLSQAYKEITEDITYSNLRTEAENSGKKITADALKVESHKSVGLWIRVRNIFESYVSFTEKAIISVQSQLNRLEKTRDYKPQENV
jgi:hypothetical protein